MAGQDAQLLNASGQTTAAPGRTNRGPATAALGRRESHVFGLGQDPGSETPPAGDTLLNRILKRIYNTIVDVELPYQRLHEYRSPSLRTSGSGRPDDIETGRVDERAHGGRELQVAAIRSDWPPPPDAPSAAIHGRSSWPRAVAAQVPLSPELGRSFTACEPGHAIAVRKPSRRQHRRLGTSESVIALDDDSSGVNANGAGPRLLLVCHSEGPGGFCPARIPTPTPALTLGPPPPDPSPPSSPMSADISGGYALEFEDAADGAAAACRLVYADPAARELLYRKEDFLIKLAHAMHSFGCPTGRMESQMAKASAGLGVPGMFAVLPTLVLISFGTEGGNKSETYLLRLDEGFDMRKLQLADRLSQRCAAGGLPLYDAVAALDDLIELPDLYPPWVNVLAFGLSSGLSAASFFNAGWVDIAVTFVLGTIVGLFDYASSRVAGVSQVMPLLSAAVVSFLARLCEVLFHRNCFFADSLAAVIWLLPGLSITLAVIELAQRHMVSGASRLFAAVVSCVMLGFGIQLGAALVFWSPDLTAEPSHCPPIPFAASFLFFPIVSVLFSLLFKASPRQFAPIVLVSSVGFCFSTFASPYLSAETGSAIAAFLVGVTGNTLARLTDVPSVVLVINGILCLVPGSVAVRGITALTDGQTVSGLAFGTRMVGIALSIAIGLFISNLVVFPDRRRIELLSISQDKAIGTVRGGYVNTSVYSRTEQRDAVVAIRRASISTDDATAHGGTGVAGSGQRGSRDNVQLRPGGSTADDTAAGPRRTSLTSEASVHGRRRGSSATPDASVHPQDGRRLSVMELAAIAAVANVDELTISQAGF